MKAARASNNLWAILLKPWASLSSPSRRLITIGAVLLQLMAVLVSLALLNMRQVALQNARQDAENLGLVIAAQTAGAVQEIDLVLVGSQKQIAVDGLATPEAMRTTLSTAAVHQGLTQELEQLPQVQGFVITGADGKVINATGQWPVAATDISGRDFYLYLKTHDDGAIYLSSPQHDISDDGWTVFAARRINGPSHQFLGVVAAGLHLGYFSDFYHSLVVHNGLTVSLLSRDGNVIASYPPIPVTGHPLTMAVRQPYLPWNAIVASGRPGAYEAPGVLSHGMRLNEVDPMQDYPLVVDIGVSEAGVLTNWRRESWIVAGGTLIAIFCVLLVLHALTLQLQRLEESEAILAEQNAALKKVEGEISYLANHDDLTGLMNRRAFHQRLDWAIGQAQRERSSMAVLYLDLDRFKIANDTRGHDFGDRLLVQLAARLRARVGAADTVARTGGDEFAILRPVAGDVPALALELVALTQELLEGIREPFEIDGTQCRIGVSIGIACYPAHGTNASDLLRNADMALYQAKADGGDVCRTFDESMNASQQELYAIEQGLRQALELRQFELNYQPILEAVSGQIIACESLLRWHHPERGLIPPMDFIGLAESLGLIIPIGYWVFEAACAEANHWPAEIAVTINLSPVQFRDVNLFDSLSEILRRTQFSPNRLILEITEGVLLEDSSHVIGIMNRLRALGIRFSLDDFGTGHSGFGYMRQFPLDGIKIDKAFVRDMEHEPQARAIVTAVLTVATALGLGVVAEGVENGAQLAALRQLGCKFVQGYFTGKPKSQSEIRSLLKQNHREVVKV